MKYLGQTSQLLEETRMPVVGVCSSVLEIILPAQSYGWTTIEMLALEIKGSDPT
jgi:hypothetical protein